MNKGIWAIAIASAFVIGVLSANPVADAMAGWKFALDEHQSDDSAHHEIPEAQVYEVSGVSIIPAGGTNDESGSEVQLRCLEGDRLISTGFPFTMTAEPIEDILTNAVAVTFGANNDIHEFPVSKISASKLIGYDVTPKRTGAIQQFEITVTVAIMCLSPSS